MSVDQTAKSSTSMHVASLAELRARQQQLVDRLRSETASGELATLKAEIIALFRETDACVAAFTALRDDVRAMVADWKAVEQQVKVTPPSTLRVDHLGASTYVEKGWSKLSTGDAAGAEDALHRALELAPSDPQALTLLAWSLAQQDKFTEAANALKASRHVAADFSLANVVDGLLALRQGNAGDSARILRSAIEDATADRRAALYAHLYLGVALREANALQESVDVLKRALELGPNMLEAALELGHTFRALGDETGALATWRRAASANKFSPWGKRCAELVELHERGEIAVGSSSTT